MAQGLVLVYFEWQRFLICRIRETPCEQDYVLNELRKEVVEPVIYSERKSMLFFKFIIFLLSLKTFSVLLKWQAENCLNRTCENVYFDSAYIYI